MESTLARCEYCGTLKRNRDSLCEYCMLTKSEVDKIRNDGYKLYDYDNRKSMERDALIARIYKAIIGAIIAMFGVILFFIGTYSNRMDQKIEGIIIFIVGLIAAYLSAKIKTVKEKFIARDSYVSKIEKYEEVIKINKNGIEETKLLMGDIKNQENRIKIANGLAKIEEINQKIEKLIIELKRQKIVIGIKEIYRSIELNEINKSLIKYINDEEKEYLNLKYGIDEYDKIDEIFEQLKMRYAQKMMEGISGKKTERECKIEEIGDAINKQIKDLEHDIDRINAEINL